MNVTKLVLAFSLVVSAAAAHGDEAGNGAPATPAQTEAQKKIMLGDRLDALLVELDAANAQAKDIYARSKDATINATKKGYEKFKSIWAAGEAKYAELRGQAAEAKQEVTEEATAQAQSVLDSETSKRLQALGIRSLQLVKEGGQKLSAESTCMALNMVTVQGSQISEADKATIKEITARTCLE